MGFSAALTAVATVCAISGESLVSAAELETGIKTGLRNSAGYAKPDQDADVKAAKAILAPTQLKSEKGNAETLKNKLFYMVAAFGPNGPNRERYVAAIGLLGYRTLATRLATSEQVPKHMKPVRVFHDSGKLIIDVPEFSWDFTKDVRGKDWEFFGAPDNAKKAFQKPYTASTGQVHQNVRVVDASRVDEVRGILKKHYGGRPLIVEGSAATIFDVLT